MWFISHTFVTVHTLAGFLTDAKWLNLKVAIIKTKSATVAFFSSPPFFLLALSFSPLLSFVSVILELTGLKKPAFRRISLGWFSKNRLDIRGTQPYVETIQGFTEILLCSFLLLCKLVD